MGDLKEVLNDLMTRFENLAKTKTVVGDPIEIKGKTLLPLIEVSIGAGGGGGSGETGKNDEKGSGVGSGGGIKVKPVAVLLIDESGMSVYGLEKKGAISKLAEIMPEMIEKLSKSKGEKKGG
jgi:uncharacterized spore protein YtfJ